MSDPYILEKKLRRVGHSNFILALIPLYIDRWLKNYSEVRSTLQFDLKSRSKIRYKLTPVAPFTVCLLKDSF